MFSIQRTDEEGSIELDRFREEVQKLLSSLPVPKVDDDSSLESFVEIGREWQKQLAQKKLVAVHWPEEFGGRGKTLVEEAIVQEELAKIGSPQLLGLFGLTMVGPLLIQHGSQEQKERFLPNILTATDVWCQGFSEPGAGSDLAAISTTAKKTDKGYIINGQKVWTSFAQVASWCFVLARTGPEDQRYKNLTYLLVDMKTPGITIRPLKQITGDEEFNEVFFDDVVVPKDMIVGSEGDGWNMAIGTLMHERVILTFARQIQSERVLRKIITTYDPDIDSESTTSICDLLSAGFSTRALAYKHLESYASGVHPGPEGSLDKLGWSEFFQQLCQFSMSSIGRDGLYETPEVQRYLYSRGRTIAAGTSEIQRNIIADRVLKLPRK